MRNSEVVDADAVISIGGGAETLNEIKRHTVESISAAKRLVTHEDYKGYAGVTGLTNLTFLIFQTLNDSCLLIISSNSCLNLRYI